MADLLHCSFCGKNQNEVQRLVAGPGVYVCGGCIATCVQILTASAPDSGSQVFRVASRRPDGAVLVSEHGSLPPVGPEEQGRNRWLRQCLTCGTWNVGATAGACGHCGAEPAGK